MRYTAMTEPTDSIQHRITGFWNAVAPHYEGHPGNTVRVGSPGYPLWTERFARCLPPASADVLDLGTGTGFAASLAAMLGHRVVGIDLSERMLAIARERAVERGLEIRFLVGDAVAPPICAGAMDVITCRHLLWTLRDAGQAFANWRTILRPNGRIVVFDAIRAEDESSADPEPDALFGRHYTPAVQAAIPFMHMTSHALLVEALAAAGFHSVAEELPAAFAEDDPGARPYVLVAARRSL
jgi:SAM-dependent methyltransferase